MEISSRILKVIIAILVVGYLNTGCAGKKKMYGEDPYPYKSPRFGKEKVEVEKHLPPTRSEPLALPGFVLAVPEGHFAGISQPCPTIASARQSAIGNVIKQVVGTMNSDVRAMYKERMKVDGLGSRHTVDDDINILAEGMVVGVEQNIVDAVVVTDAFGRYVCYMLVRYPDELINEMRRLSLGANLIPSLKSLGDKNVKIQVSETNRI